MGDSLAIVRENERKKEYLKGYIYSVQKAQRLKEQIAVEMDYNHEVITGDYTCAYSYAYRSIMGNGTITEVTDPEAKKKGLGKIMAHIAPEAKIAFLPEMVERVAVWRIDIDTFTGKERRRK